MKKIIKPFLLLLSIGVIIISWEKLSGLLAGLISGVISILWVLYEGDKQKMKNHDNKFKN